MKILQNWKIIVIAFLVIWGVILIHPFTKTGAEVTIVENPASLVLREGDFISSINGNKITNYDSFVENAKKVEDNGSVKVTIERETFPYTYTQITHTYITNTDDNPISFYAKESPFSKLKFNSQLQESNKFTIKTSNPDNTIDVLSKRFKNARIHDYTFKKQGNDVILYTTSGEELSKLIETQGKFEAKLAGETLFTDKDIESYCLSGVNCMVNTYPILNQEQESTEVVWKYGFETHITDKAAGKFPGLAKDLGILKCEFDRCLLNESIQYFLDGENVGFEELYATDKERNLSRTFIGGEAKTKLDATTNLYFLQAILQGRSDAEIEKIEQVPALMGENVIGIVFFIIGGIILLNTLLILIQFKDIRTALSSLVLGASEIIIVFGILSGLKFTLSLMSLIVIIAMPVITLIYQNYSIRWIKKEGLILKKIGTLNNKLNKWMWIVTAIIILGTLFAPSIGTPLIIYFMTMIILTKGTWFRAVKAKKD